jgi:acid phosphatase (class A)
MKRPFLLQALLAVALLLAGKARAQAPVAGSVPVPSARFVRSDAFDFAKILPTPPEPGTLAAVAELEVVLQVQAWRTPEQVAWAKRIDAGEIFDFADVLGDWFTKEKLPVTAALMEAVDWEVDAGVRDSKKAFARPRPFIVDARVQPCVKRLDEASYPSGHAADYFFRAGVLAEIFPGKRAELFEFAQKAAWSRVLGGVHFPTDLVGGRLLAAAVVEELKKNQTFQMELKKSRAEVAAKIKK